MGYSIKTSKQGVVGVEDNYFWKKNPEIFRFVTLPLKIPEKTSLNCAKLCDNPWKFHCQKLRPLKFPYEFFLNTSESSTSFFNWPLQFPHALSLISLEIPHGCSNQSNLEMAAEFLTKNVSYLSLNISRTKNGRNKL